MKDQEITAKCADCFFFVKKDKFCLMKRQRVFDQSVCVDFTKDLNIRKNDGK